MDIVHPTLILDKGISIRNIEKMVKKAKSKKLILRPHFKTHQSSVIGEWFREFGIDKITVSSVRMAAYFAENGWNDITIAVPLNILEIDSINSLAGKINLNLLIENKESLVYLDKFIKYRTGIFIEIDTGHNRTGIFSTLTKRIDSLLDITDKNKLLDFKGFLSHTGQTYEAKSSHEIFNAHFDALLKMRELKNHYGKSRPGMVLSLGDTPSASICDNFDGIDEIRPGNFVFYDLMQYKLGVCKFENIALRLVCPVIAKHPSRNEVVIYGGAVHLSKDSITNTDGKEMYGQIVVNINGEKTLLDEKNYLSRLSQEHGVIRVTQREMNCFNIGDLIEVIPVHSCLTANLMKGYITKDGDFIPMMSPEASLPSST